MRIILLKKIRRVVIQLREILTKEERTKAVTLLIVLVLMAFFDTLGVASIMPFIAVLLSPELAIGNSYLKTVYLYFGAPDLQDFQVVLGAFFFACVAFSLAFKAFGTWLLVEFTYACQCSLSGRLMASYLQQPYAWFLNRHSSELGKTILSEVDQVIDGVLVPLINLVAQGVLAIALLFLVVIVDPLLAALIILFFLFVYCGIYILFRSRLSRSGADRINANKLRFSILAEAFGALKDIKLNGIEYFYIDRFQEAAYRFARSKTFSQVISKLPRFLLEALVFGGILLMTLVLFKVKGSYENVIPLVTLYAFTGYRLMPAMQQIYSNLSTLRFSHSALDGLHREMIALQLPNKTAQNATFVDLKHSISTKKIYYRYPQSNNYAIKCISIDIPARTTVAFVGTTGSGKTTLVDVILGLLEPQAGRVLIDGLPLTIDTLGDWQNKVGYVPQVIYIVDDTISANIAFGSPGAKIDRVALERAARIASLHDFVSNELPNGYETRVGERGVRLSGGQRQRIGIARALYRNPQVLILDEATSALDNLTEHSVMEAVQQVSHQMTVIIVAHRLSSLKECDAIFVFDKGELVGKGGYEDLIATNEQFIKLAKIYRT
jgi:ABC-type bacteriocin/lantibiotic exporter with double-glycine peptidase domain